MSNNKAVIVTILAVMCVLAVIGVVNEIVGPESTITTECAVKVAAIRTETANGEALKVVEFTAPSGDPTRVTGRAADEILSFGINRVGQQVRAVCETVTRYDHAGRIREKISQVRSWHKPAAANCLP